MDSIKNVVITEKQTSEGCSWMTHYTLKYRGREYNETLQGESKDRYEVGDIVTASTFRDKNQNLCFSLRKTINR